MTLSQELLQGHCTETETKSWLAISKFSSEICHKVHQLKHDGRAVLFAVVELLAPAIHIRTIPAFTPRPQGVTTFWLILIAPTHEGMARLSWPGWRLHTEINSPHRKLNPDTVTYLNNRARSRLTSSLAKRTRASTTPDHRHCSNCSTRNVLTSSQDNLFCTDDCNKCE